MRRVIAFKWMTDGGFRDQSFFLKHVLSVRLCFDHRIAGIGRLAPALWASQPAAMQHFPKNR